MVSYIMSACVSLLKKMIIAVEPRSMLPNKTAVGGQQFTAVLAFTDPGVGVWTIQVADGAATVSEGDAVNADLVITQSAEAFEKYIRRTQTPAQAIQSGEIQVSDFESLATFGQLFPV